jgi:DNA polymerase V
MPDEQIRKKMTVTGLRTVWELRGISCLALDEMAPDKKAIGCSRMFGRLVQERKDNPGCHWESRTGNVRLPWL